MTRVVLLILLSAVLSSGDSLVNASRRKVRGWATFNRLSLPKNVTAHSRLTLNYVRELGASHCDRWPNNRVM